MLTPDTQGTLVERIRAGGVGRGGVLTPTDIGTPVAEGKRVIEVTGKDFLLEIPLQTDFAPIAARRADYVGNLDHTLTAQNLIPVEAGVFFEAENGVIGMGARPPEGMEGRDLTDVGGAGA